MLENLKNASGYIMRRIFEEDPEGSFGGGAGKLPHRYSLGPTFKNVYFLDSFGMCVSVSSCGHVTMCGPNRQMKKVFVYIYIVELLLLSIHFFYVVI